MKNIGLVLEGGGMRGIFTAGVVDYFLENKIYFPYLVGTSAGASNSISYVSRQHGRGKTVNIDYLEKYPYIGLSQLFKSGNIMDYKFLFEKVPQELYPIDLETFVNSDTKYITVATNCLTGEAAYFEKEKTYDRIVDVCRASCSLPVLCKPIFIDGIPYLDGGISDSIPLKKSLSDGNTKSVVVLTRHCGYRKPERDIKLPFFIYRKYPKLKEALKRRNYEYNKSMDFIEKLEKEKQILVIRPTKLYPVSRMEKNIQNLKNLYMDAKIACQAIQKELDKLF